MNNILNRLEALDAKLIEGVGRPHPDHGLADRDFATRVIDAGPAPMRLSLAIIDRDPVAKTVTPMLTITPAATA